jgi:GTP 3',8-cyclase
MQAEIKNYKSSPYYDTCANMVKLLVTERCNLKCPYCTHPPAKVDELSLDEIRVICESFVAAGMNRIKICGGAYGEPLLRTDIIEIVKIAKESGFIHVGLATNGSLLTKNLVQDLIDSGLTWITHSLTTINPKHYQDLYKAPLKNESLDAIGKYDGLERYQINCVILKDHNADDLEALIEFAHSKGANVHFMELIGHEDNWDYYNKNFIDAEFIKERLFGKSHSYQYKKLDMTHVYVFEKGNVSVKQTRHEESACSICRRMFVSSEGKMWFCRPENILMDFRAEESSTEKIVGLMENRYNDTTKNGQIQRLQHGCARSCDGCSLVLA